MFDTIQLDNKTAGQLKLTKSQQKIIDTVDKHLSEAGKPHQVLTSIFQTKDLSCTLDHYTINNRGNIVLVSDSGKKTKQDFTAPITIYTYVTCDKSSYDVDVELTLDVRRSKVTKITANHIRKSDNSSRLKMEIDYRAEAQKTRELKKKTWYKVYKFAWEKPFTFACRKIGSFLHRAGCFVAGPLLRFLTI